MTTAGQPPRGPYVEEAHFQRRRDQGDRMRRRVLRQAWFNGDDWAGEDEDDEDDDAETVMGG